MHAFEATSYKTAIRDRLKELKLIRPALSFRFVAGEVPMQYTYLSKVLNSDVHHLSEDHLYRVAQLLEFTKQETEYLFLLRSKESTQSADRRQTLELEIARVRKAHQLRAPLAEVQSEVIAAEMSYLTDPFCPLVHGALTIETVRRQPKLLLDTLGIDLRRLRGVLRTLRDLKFIETGKDELQVRKVLQSRLHFGTNHPLMRVHQQQVRAFGTQQLLKTPEDQKHGFQVTFSADAQTFEKIKTEFNAFISKVEKLVVPAGNENLYQLGFDLFRWF